MLVEYCIFSIITEMAKPRIATMYVKKKITEEVLSENKNS